MNTVWNSELGITIVAVTQLVSRAMWGLAMVLKGYGRNSDELRRDWTGPVTLEETIILHPLWTDLCVE